MRKVLFALLAVLFIAGVAFAHTIGVDPKAGPMIQTIPVFNNHASTTMDAGDVVVWDIGNSTGDNDNYVTLSTTADTGLVAGVIWPASIVAQSTGTMAIYGMVECDVAALVVSEHDQLCTSTTSGAGKGCAFSAAGAGGNNYAIAGVASTTASQIACFVDN